MVGIYKITNPSGKVYIGQSVNIESRKNNYIKLHKNSIGPKLYNSLLKHGWEQHDFNIIEECLIEDLNEREEYWKQYELNKKLVDFANIPQELINEFKTSIGLK